MNTIENVLTNIIEAGAVADDVGLRAKRVVQSRLDQKTKPPGSLGTLEEIACRVALIQGIENPQIARKSVVVMAADHGVCEEQISAYPSEVTAQMVANIASGGAAISVLSRAAGARLRVVDIGVKGPASDLAEVTVRRVADGTANISKQPAMSLQEVERALMTGIQIAQEEIKDGAQLIALGEMGIGNTTASTALTAYFSGEDVDSLTGRGTGIDDEGRVRKVNVVRRAILRHQETIQNGTGPFRDRATAALAGLGGLEIAGLAGVAIGSAALRVPLLLDGLISSCAALVATEMKPEIASYLFASHRSQEPAHQVILNRLGLRPILDLNLRLGEGTGAALSMPIFDSAIRLLEEMATFESAGVSQKS